jgi:hypothetical protein
VVQRIGSVPLLEIRALIAASSVSISNSSISMESIPSTWLQEKAAMETAKTSENFKIFFMIYVVFCSFEITFFAFHIQFFRRVYKKTPTLAGVTNAFRLFEVP